MGSMIEKQWDRKAQKVNYRVTPTASRSRFLLMDADELARLRDEINALEGISRDATR